MAFPQLHHAHDSFLALTTDGINFIMNSQEICNVINQCHDPKEAAQRIADQVRCPYFASSGTTQCINTQWIQCMQRLSIIHHQVSHLGCTKDLSLKWEMPICIKGRAAWLESPGAKLEPGLLWSDFPHVVLFSLFSLFSTAQRTTARLWWCPLVLGESTRARTPVSPSAEVSCPAVAGRRRAYVGGKSLLSVTQFICAIQSENGAPVETLRRAWLAQTVKPKGLRRVI